MKIAFLSFYSGVVYRGVETFVHELSNGLVELGHDVTVYQIGKQLPGAIYKTVIVSSDINLQRKNSYIPFLNYYALNIKRFTQKVLRKIDKDTEVIFPTNGQWQSLLCSIWAKRKNKKIIISGQSGPGIDDRINIWTFPNRFVGLTEFQTLWASKANPFVKVHKIPNGVDVKKFTENIQHLNMGLPKPIILCVAAFDYWKRLDLAIKAVSELKSASLVLVGKGPEESKLFDLGNKLLPGRFKIMSFAHKDMPKVYGCADLFTFPTVPWESFGIVLVEAMASGVPVVATEDPIRQEIIGSAGILVDPTDTSEYAQALQKALDTNWGDKPRKQSEKFGWDRIAKEYEKLFNTL